LFRCDIFFLTETLPCDEARGATSATTAAQIAAVLGFWTPMSGAGGEEGGGGGIESWWRSLWRAGRRDAVAGASPVGGLSPAVVTTPRVIRGVVRGAWRPPNIEIEEVRPAASSTVGGGVAVQRGGRGDTGGGEAEDKRGDGGQQWLSSRKTKLNGGGGVAQFA
jgi:hypothetical protein